MTMPRARPPRRGTASKPRPRSIDDFAALELAFDRTPRGRAARRKILALQRRLERRVDKPTWRIYCALEALSNERLAHYLAYIYALLVPGPSTRSKRASA